MINFDAIDNFITRALIKREKYFIRRKSNAYNLVIINENSLLARNKKVNKETKPLLIAI
jgi:hypothetical protein